jgi:hypothetical protein
MATLRVRWRGAVYEIATCLNAERAKAAAALWPDGVVDLARVLEPGRPATFSQAERVGLVKMALRALGELEPRKSAALPDPRKARMVPVPATFGTTGKRAAWQPLARARRIDHAFVAELAQQKKPAPEPLPAYAVKAVSL